MSDADRYINERSAKDREWLTEVFARAGAFFVGIDFQKQYFGHPNWQANVETANDLAATLRRRGVDIVWVLQVSDWKDATEFKLPNLPYKDTLVKGIKPKKGDYGRLKNPTKASYTNVLAREKHKAKLTTAIMTGGRYLACFEGMLYQSLGGRKKGLKAVIVLDATDLSDKLTAARETGSSQEEVIQMLEKALDRWGDRHVYMTAEQVKACMTEGLARHKRNPDIYALK